MSHPDFMYRQRGMTLVEAMVGIAIGLLVGLAAAGMAQVFTASQRQGMGVGSVSMNANMALTSIRQDVGQAGLGFFGEGRYLCDRMNLSVGTAIVMDNALFTPVSATRPANSNFDTLNLTYATHIAGGTTVNNRGTSAGAWVFLDSLLPGQVGDTVMMSSAGAPRTCTIRTLTQVVPSTASTPQQLVFAPAGIFNSNAVSFTPPISVPEGSSVALLGNLVMRSYSVDAQRNLIMTDQLTGQASTLASEVVAFRIEFGVSKDAAATSLSGWQDPATFGVISAANISQLRAVRVGLVTRSQQREKPDQNGRCQASQAQPTLFGATITDPVLQGEDWRCFRYRVAIAVIPMRNIAIGLPGAGIQQTGGKSNL